MALTLDDIIAAPSDPELLNRHLQGLGLLARPEAPPAPAPVTVAPMSPVTPKSEVAPMTPPAVRSETAHPTELTGLNRELALGATSQPSAVSARNTELGTAPEISSGAPAAEPVSGIKPLVPPKLTHTEKMALPLTSPGVDVGSSAFTRNEIERLEEQKAHPWGTTENHPGLLGKIGHVAGRIGNVAADVLAPGIALNIPGSDLQRRGEENALKRELATRTAAEGQAKNLESEEAARDVQTAEGRERLKKMQTEQSLERDTEGNITGWKGPDGKLHSLDEEGTPQAIKDIAEATQNKPHFEKSANGDIVQITPGKNGAAATSNVVYKGQPNQKTETRAIVGPDGHAHDQVIDITPGSPTFGKSLADLGRSKEDKPESPTAAINKEKAGERVVLAYDKDGKAHLMSKNDADEEGMQHITAAKSDDIDKAKTHHVVLNTLQTQLNSVVDASKALDQNIFQRGIIAKALSHPTQSTVDELFRAGVLAGATEDTKRYVQAVIALREAGLALPKEITGGSRVSEVQASALWATMPSAGSLDSKYALKQAKKFQQDIDRLRERAPEVRGLTLVDPDEAIKSKGEEKQHKVGETAGAPQPPPGKVVVYDQQKQPHFVNENAVDEFLKDPKYKGWTRGPGR